MSRFVIVPGGQESSAVMGSSGNPRLTRTVAPWAARRTAHLGLVLVLLASLAVTLGLGMGARASVAHAAPMARTAQVAAASGTCLPKIKATSSTTYFHFALGYLIGYVYGNYDASGQLCSSFANAKVRLLGGALPGTINVYYFDCNGHQQGFGSIHVSGGGDTGQIYYMSTNLTSVYCGRVLAFFWFDGGTDSYQAKTTNIGLG